MSSSDNSGRAQSTDLRIVSDLEISKLAIKRNIHQYAVEQYDELINKIGQAKGFVDAGEGKAAKQSTENTSSALPGTDVSKLPWKSYKTKQEATPDEAAWIFSNTQGAEALLATLKSNDGKKTIGDFEYQLQGNEKQFIARKPKA